MNKYEKIKKLCKERGSSVAQMERDLNFARGSIAKIDEHKPSIEKVSKICLYLQVSPMALFLDEETDDETYNRMLHYMDEINAQNTEVERSLYEVAAGNGRINDGCFAEESADTIRDYSFVRICGDSMYPTLHDGDIVKVHHITDGIAPSDLAVVKVNGDESTVKHIEITSEGIWLRADNKDVFEDKFYSVQDVLTLPITIIGVAEEIVSRKL